jgi:hypothetical protein
LRAAGRANYRPPHARHFPGVLTFSGHTLPAGAPGPANAGRIAYLPGDSDSLGSHLRDLVGYPGGEPPRASGSFLAATTVLSPCDAWAVGWAANGGVNQTLTEHWDGASWTVVASPDPGTAANLLNGVHAISSDDVWAVGAYADSSADRTLILHWNGSSWTKVASPNPGNVASLSGIDAVSASDAWAVGQYSVVAAGARGRSAVLGTHTLVLHWNGSTWKQVASPNPVDGGGLTAVTATSASNAWAVGGFTAASSTNQNLILRRGARSG